MIGRVGDDSMADRLVQNLQVSNRYERYGVANRDCASGIAVVAVEASGENAIMVVPGANGRVSVEDVEDGGSDPA